MLCTDPRNPRAETLRARIAEHVDLDGLPDEVRLVIGGDGWMLQCIRELGGGGVFLGLNAGHLGFLLNDVDDVADVGALLRERRWTAWSFPRLEMAVGAPDGSERTSLAVNDLYVERASGQTAHLRVRIDGVTVVERLVCDGLLVATALGSTAYSYSAGGVPCHPLVPGVTLTPVCPHAPRLSPCILPLGAEIEVEAHHPTRRRVRAVADGDDQGPVASARIRRAPGQEVHLAFLEGHAFTRTLIRKVLKS